jgi:hypothetical protein
MFGWVLLDVWLGLIRYLAGLVGCLVGLVGYLARVYRMVGEVLPDAWWGLIGYLAGSSLDVWLGLYWMFGGVFIGCLMGLTGCLVGVYQMLGGFLSDAWLE